MGIEEFKPLVFVRCVTYNHEKYIEDALKGFIMQKANFPIVVVIVNDASTDNTDTVVRSFINDNFDTQGEGYYCQDTDYAHIIHAYYKNNKNCLFYYLSLRINHYGKISHEPYYKRYSDVAKYWAECEGDDYWTDPLKLQKQVNFLDAHKEYSMCFHAAEVKYDGKGYDSYCNGTHFLHMEDREYSSTEVASKWMVPTASIVYKRALVETYQIKHPEWLAFGDITLVLKCSHTGKIFGMSDVMSVYRIQPNSVTNKAEYVNSTVFKLPDHYRCLRMNFPKVEKGPLEWSISHYSYVRMKKQSNPFLKIRDFFMFVWWDPKQAMCRIKSVIARKK